MKLKPKGILDTHLTEEARRFKTAEEFVEAQGTPLYNGTDGDPLTFNTSDTSMDFSSKNSRGDNIGGFFASKKADAADFGKNVREVFVKTKNPKVFKTQNAFREYMREHSGRTPDVRDKEGFILEEGVFENNMRRDIEAEGYDGVVIKNPQYSSKRDKPWVLAFKQDQIKTKSQLTDIWNKANAQTGEQSLTGYRKNTSEGKHGTFYFQEKGLKETAYKKENMQKTKLEFNNLLEVRNEEVSAFSGLPSEVLAGKWFPEMDFRKKAKDLCFEESGEAMDYMIAREAIKKGYDGIKYGDFEIQDLSNFPIKFCKIT